MNERLEKSNLSELSNPEVPYVGFKNQSEDERLLEDVKRSDIEKLKLFTRMLKRNATLNKVAILKKSNNL